MTLIELVAELHSVILSNIKMIIMINLIKDNLIVLLIRIRCGSSDSPK